MRRLGVLLVALSACDSWESLGAEACLRSPGCSKSDAGRSDAGLKDAGVIVDGGVVDAGAVDAGTDAGVDAGTLLGEPRLVAQVWWPALDAGSQFGRRVALSPTGEWLVVLAPGAQAGSGAAFLFQRGADGGFALRDEVAGDGGTFGAALAFSPSGRRLAISATDLGQVGTSFSEVRWFALDAGRYVLDGIVPGESNYGAAVAFLDETSPVISRPVAYLGSAAGAAGAVMLPDGGALLAPSPHDRMFFGTALATARGGTRLFVSAFGDGVDAPNDSADAGDAGAVGNSGAVYVFDRAPNGRWLFSRRLKASALRSEMRLGLSLAAHPSGNGVIAGAPGDANAAGAETQVGSAWGFFERDAGWAVTSFRADDERSFGGFGVVAGAADGRSFAIAGPGAGRAPREAVLQTYDFETGAVTSQTYGNQADDFGRALALSADGRLIAVGAPTFSPCTGADDGGCGRGAVLLYAR